MIKKPGCSVPPRNGPSPRDEGIETAGLMAARMVVLIHRIVELFLFDHHAVSGSMPVNRTTELESSSFQDSCISVR